MFCENCGNNIGIKRTCPECGAAQSNKKLIKPKNNIQNDNSIVQNYNQPTTTKEKLQPTMHVSSSFLWGLLGFLLPVIGLILCIYWRKHEIKRKYAIKIGIAINIVIWFILPLIVSAISSSSIMLI